MFSANYREQYNRFLRLVCLYCLLSHVAHHLHRPYLEKHVDKKALFTVYKTSTTKGEFMYDKFTSDGSREEPRTYQFEPSVTKEKSTFAAFHQLLERPLAEELPMLVNHHNDNEEKDLKKDFNLDLKDLNLGETKNTNKMKSISAAPSPPPPPPPPPSSTTTTTRQQRLYLQQALFDGIGKQIKKDFSRFHWAWIQAMQALLPSIGDLTTNMLLIGEFGNVTPCHYDEQQNFFAQVDGHKRCVLFAPHCYSQLYPYPVGHPADRQAQTNLYHQPSSSESESSSSVESLEESNNDNHSSTTSQSPQVITLTTKTLTAALPSAASTALLKGMEIVLEPGDVLYIPNMWYHHFENLSTPCTSVNFWFKCGKDDPNKVELPLRDPSRLMSMRRNIEKLSIQKLGSFQATLFFASLELRYNTIDTTTAPSAPTEERRSNVNFVNDSQSDELSKGSATERERTNEMAERKMLFEAHEKAVRAMLKVVLAPEDIDPFLYELVNGRYVNDLMEHVVKQCVV